VTLNFVELSTLFIAMLVSLEEGMNKEKKDIFLGFWQVSAMNTGKTQHQVLRS